MANKRRVLVKSAAYTGGAYEMELQFLRWSYFSVNSDRTGQKFLYKMVLIPDGFHLGRLCYLFSGGFAGLSQGQPCEVWGKEDWQQVARSPPQFPQSGSVLICSQYWAMLYVSV